MYITLDILLLHAYDNAVECNITSFLWETKKSCNFLLSTFSWHFKFPDSKVKQTENDQLALWELGDQNYILNCK